MTNPIASGSSAADTGNETDTTRTVAELPVDYFVSRRGADALIAQEVAQVLIDAGYTAFVQDFDIPYTANFLAAMHEALKHCRHFIVLLTKDYDASDFTLAELTNFLATAARAGDERRLVVLRIEDVAPEGLLAGIVYGDLVGVTDEKERKKRILAAAEGRSPAAARRPKVFHNVPQRDLNFTGRENVLTNLHQLLRHAEQPAAIHGLGGIGKTSLATEYAHRYAGEYAGVWWVPAENRTVLLASLAALASQLEPRLAKEPDQETAARAGFAHLARAAVPYLLVYDNVETPVVLRELVPSVGARVLVTTRWADWSGRAVDLELDVLGSEAAVDFLQKRAGRVDAPGAMRLAEALGCLPLALDHAGAYCRLSGVSFDGYRKKVDIRIAKAPEGAAYPASVAATFGLAIEKAVAKQPAAETLLGFCAYLAPEHIPLELIESEVTDEDERAEALMTLSAVSLVEHGELNSGEPALTLHRLVQAAMRAHLTDRAETVGTAERVIHRLANVFPANAYKETSVWPRCATLMPHVLALRNQMLQGSGSAELAKLLDAAGNYLHGRGAYADAEPLLKDALAIGERTLGRSHPDITTLLCNLAYFYHSTGRYAEAEPLYKEAIETGEKTLGRQHPNSAIWLSNLALLYRATGRYAEAEPLYKEAIATGEKAFGRQHPNVAVWLNNLAYLYFSTDRYAEAEPLLLEAITNCKNTLGHQHPYIATQIGNLADLYRDTGRYAEAEPLYKEAIALSEKNLGREHPNVASQISNLAALYRAMKHYDEAEPLLKEALAIGTKVLGHQHPNIAAYLNNLALLYRDTGQYAEAEPLFQEALAIGERTLGCQHPSVANYLKNLIKVMEKLDRHPEAASLQARYGLK